MKDKYRFIVDSSVWVEFERDNRNVKRRLTPLVEKNRVCLVDLIVAELLRGARSDQEYKKLNLHLGSFETLSTSWSAVGELGFAVARRGYTPPLADLYIAQCAIDHKRTLITQDFHFEQIARVRSFSLETW